MATEILLPDAIDVRNGWNNGETDIDEGVTTPDDDSSFMWIAATSTNHDLILGLADTGLTSITLLTARIRIRFNATVGNTSTFEFVPQVGGADVGAVYSDTAKVTYETFEASWAGTWTQAEINGLQFRIRHKMPTTPSGDVRLTAAEIEVTGSAGGGGGSDPDMEAVAGDEGGLPPLPPFVFANKERRRWGNGQTRRWPNLIPACNWRSRSCRDLGACLSA